MENENKDWLTLFVPENINDGCWDYLIPKINDWYNNYNQPSKKNNHKERILLLTGNSGVGKYTFAKLFLQHKGFNNICTHYASDIRGKENIKDILIKSCSYYNILDLIDGKSKIQPVIIKEFEDLAVSFTEFIKYINEIPLNKQGPIICISNTYIKAIAPISFVITINPISNFYLKKIIHKICTYKNLIIDEDYYSLIANKAQGDIRCLIKCLYDIFIMFGPNVPINENMLQQCLKNFYIKDLDINRFEAVRHILNIKKNISFDDIENYYNIDNNLIPLYLWENNSKIFINNHNKGYSALQYLMEYDILFTQQDEFTKYSFAGNVGCLGQRLCMYDCKSIETIELTSSTLYNRSTQKKKEYKNLRLLPGELQLQLNHQECIHLIKLIHSYIIKYPNDNQTIIKQIQSLMKSYNLTKEQLVKLLNISSSLINTKIKIDNIILKHLQ